MAAAPAQLLPILLLTCAWPFFAGSRARGAPAAAAAILHPVVLLPGYSCSQLDARLTDEFDPSTAPSCGARRGKGWFRLWQNHTALQEDPALVPCYSELLRLVYDPAVGDYRNLPGVETRVVSFGTTRGFGTGDPAAKNICMEKLVHALEGVGYREGENLFGAPYDFRYAPALPGEASKVFSYFVSSLRALVEQASERNGSMPVILVSHSLGGLNANVFLRRSSPAWRARYVKHFVMASTGAGGGVPALLRFRSGPSPSPPTGGILSSANTTRSFATMLFGLPSPKVFGHAPLVITRTRNYSAYDIVACLKASSGFCDGEAARYVTRVLPVALNFGAPGVPMTCINGVGVPTAEKLVYWDGDFSAKPEAVYGDGDGTINIQSMLALDTFIGADPAQDYFKSLLIHNTSHVGIVSDDYALRRLVNEVLEANRAID